MFAAHKDEPKNEIIEKLTVLIQPFTTGINASKDEIRASVIKNMDAYLQLIREEILEERSLLRENDLVTFENS